VAERSNKKREASADREAGVVFYERGCQEKILPADRTPWPNSVMAASPASVARVLIARFDNSSIGSSTASTSVRKLKSGAVDVADHSSI
jgi:hypothetical protein